MRTITPAALSQLRDDMHIVHGTTVGDIIVCGYSSKQKRVARRKERERNDRIFDLFFEKDYQSVEEACASIVAIILPFLLRWFLRAAVERVIKWLWNRTH